MSRPSTAACAVATRNYLASARVLSESWLDHHPGSTVTVVLLDGDPAAVDWRPDGVEVVTPTDVGLADDELLRMAAIYGPGELAMALKPWVLRHLLERADVALYFDGDIEVLAPVDDLGASALDGVLLTPHTLGPLPDDGRLPAATTILLSGIYNAGFVGVSAHDGGFLDWWAGVLARHCIHDLDRGLHGDQRWLDFVPSYFPHVILRDPTANVAYWNLHERPLDWSDGRLLTDGRPVRFFHYSGLSPERPWGLSQYAGPEPRTILATSPPVARATRRWLRRLDAAGRADDQSHPYRFAATERGLPLDTRARRVYRQALLDHEAGAGPEPPNPFADDGGETFEAWLFDAADDRPLGRYVRRIWEESEPMQGRYPDVDGADLDGWLRWVAHHGRLGAAVPDVTHAKLGIAIDPDEEPAVTPPPDPFPAAPPAGAERGDAVEDDGSDRSRSPLPQLDVVADLLERPFDVGPAPLPGPAGRRVQEALLRFHDSRDERAVEVGRELTSAIDELRHRVAVLGTRLEHALTVDLATHAARLAILEEAALGADKAGEDLARAVEARADGQDDRIGALASLVDGGLEQDVITANIVADTERRLLDELQGLRARLAERQPPPDGASD